MKKGNERIRVNEAMVVKQLKHQVFVKTPISKSLAIKMDVIDDAERFFLTERERIVGLGMKQELYVCAQIAKWAKESGARIVNIANDIDDFGAPTIDFTFIFADLQHARSFEMNFKEHVCV